MNLYIDIDGVLLTKSLRIPKNGIEFLEYCVNNFNCYWLTTHCRHNENNAVKYLLQAYPIELKSSLELIKPTNWDSLKTEGIDFTKPFYWLDDYPMQSELRELEKHNVMDAMIKVDLSKSLELKRIISILTAA
ncbi:MAG: hypothetical protein ACPGLV_03755 [Bacteroidia bacterium]